MKKRNTNNKKESTNTTTNTNTNNTTTSTPSIFTNPEFGSVRVLPIDNEPWFVGKDVAEALGFKNTKDAITNHVEECDKIMGSPNATPSITDSIGRKQFPTWINESGLYSLIFSSKLPSAKKFKHWVTAEVLPTIRKTGGYVHNEDVFINTYLPFADESTKILFRTTLHTIQEQNTLIRTQQDTITKQNFGDRLFYLQKTMQIFIPYNYQSYLKAES